MATAAIGVLLAVGAAHSTANRYLEQPEILLQTAAEDAFPDAAFGVDPMVTGPTSAAFEKRRAELGCDKAIWPHIPLGCYPNR